MRTVTCRCETTFDANLPEEINLDESTTALGEILSGAFFSATCPSCGTTLKPELRVRLRSPTRKLDLFLLPELERLSFYLGSFAAPAGSEILIGFPELYERALELRDGLDSVTVEILKYYLLGRAEEESSGEEPIGINYAGLGEDGRLSFRVSGIRKGEFAILPLNREQYEKVLADKARLLRTEPFDRMFAGAYRSVRTLEMAED